MSERDWLSKVVPPGVLEDVQQMFEQADVKTQFKTKGNIPPVHKDEAPPQRPSASEMGYGGDGLGELTDPYSDHRMITQADRDELKRNASVQGAKDLDVDKMSDDEVRKYIMGKRGFAGTRINSHYGGMDTKSLSTDEQKQVVDLSTDEKRLKELGQLRQNGMAFDGPSNFQCGATSLVGGAMYGGGYQGLAMLVNDIVADRAKKKLVKDRSGGNWADSVAPLLAAINAQSMTRLQLFDLVKLVYEHFNQEQNGDKRATEGLDGHKLNDFIAQHKDMHDMFKSKDMALDSIDLNGDGRGDHLVLGIGHTRDTAGRQTRSMIFDPEGRQDKRNSGQFMNSATLEKIEREERAKMQPQFDALKGKEGKEWETEYDKLQAKLQDNISMRKNEYKHDSQLITDAHELDDYRKATDYEAGGDKTVVERDAQTQSEDADVREQEKAKKKR